MALISWISKNKLSSLLILVLFFFLITSFSGSSKLVSKTTENIDLPMTAGGMGMPSLDYVPQPSIANRMVVENSYLSLLVKDVTDVKDKIISYAQTHGGYMVDSQVSNPQDAPTATVTIRVQSSKIKEALDYFHSLSVKVVSENLEGTDVTDQYVDVEKRIALLEATKVKFETILTTAKEISDITNITREILNYQGQIDTMKGSQIALEKNSQLAKITIYLSTDEIALPYAPSETFRPAVIFKLAVRSLVSVFRKIATIVIWLVVFGVIWIPALIVIWYIRKNVLKRNLS